MSQNLITTGLDAPIATLTLNRPERHNSLIPELLSELLDALGRVESDDSVGVVVLAANGRSFSTGGDVAAFYERKEDLADYAREVVGLLNRVIIKMMRLPQPVIAAVHGIVTGGSLGLVLAADVPVLTPEVTFTPWYSVVGFAPDGGWTAILPRRIGIARAARILLTNETITANEAVAWGLASEMVPAEELRPRVIDLATAISQGRVSAIKRALHDDLEETAALLERERELFVEQVVSEESLAGMAVFLGKS